MKGIFRSNLDLDVIVSKEEVEGIKLQSKVTRTNSGWHVDYHWPIIFGNVENEEREIVGTIRLQQGIWWKILEEKGRDTKIDRGLFIRENGPHWFLQLVGKEADSDLIEGNLTRRLPYHQSQLWIYIKE